MRPLLQFIARLLLGAVALPLILLAFLVFSLAVICSEARWSHVK